MAEEELKMRNSLELPEDIVVEILSRIPAVSLARLRCTSKGWNSLIKDERLANKNSANAPRESSLIIMLIGFRIYLTSIDLHGIHDDEIVKVTSQFSLKDPFSISLEQVDIREVFHCDGLLLCTTKDNRLVVWNPCSGETRWIQPKNSYKKYNTYALGKSSCNKYKILSISQNGNMKPCLVEYEIYDFTSNSWRCVGDTRDWFIPWLRHRGTSVNGNTYWLVSSQNIPSGDILISFDFSTERFVTMSLPGDNLVFALSVTREEQQLCILATPDRAINDADISVWIATKIESSGATSWTKFLSVEKRTYGKQHFCLADGMNFLADCENKVIVCRGKHWVSEDFLNIVGEDTFIQVHRQGAGSQCSLLVSYVPTLAHIQQGSSGVGARKAPN